MIHNKTVMADVAIHGCSFICMGVCHSPVRIYVMYVMYVMAGSYAPPDGLCDEEKPGRTDTSRGAPDAHAPLPPPLTGASSAVGAADAPIETSW